MTAADTPLRVCLLVTAYNHAAWVREACEAALQQDYGPLDIIFLTTPPATTATRS